jgi:putative serine/threonine protein kinase
MEFRSLPFLELLDYPRGDLKEAEKLFRELNSLGVKLLSFVSKGYRGVVFKGLYRGEPVAVKVVRSDAGKENLAEKEFNLLKLLSERLGPRNPAPRPYLLGSRFLVEEWVEGTPFSEAFNDSPRRAVVEALKAVRALDEAKVEHGEIKGEKHLLLSGNGARLIDFESAREKERPRNLLQFVGYHLLRLPERLQLLGVERRQLLKLLNEYKSCPSEENFRKLLLLFNR